MISEGFDMPNWENMTLSDKFLFTDQKRSVPLYNTSVVRNECTDILL